MRDRLRLADNSLVLASNYRPELHQDTFHANAGTSVWIRAVLESINVRPDRDYAAAWQVQRFSEKIIWS